MNLESFPSRLNDLISAPIPVQHIEQQLFGSSKSERVSQDSYWGTCWFVSVIDLFLKHNDGQDLRDMIKVFGSYIRIDWKATPIPIRCPTTREVVSWDVLDGGCSVRLEAKRRAVGGNPLMIAGSCGKSTLDLDVRNDNLLVEILMEGFTKLMCETVYKQYSPSEAKKRAYAEMDGDDPEKALRIFTGQHATVQYIGDIFNYYNTSNNIQYIKTPEQLRSFLSTMHDRSIFIVGTVSKSQNKERKMKLIPGHAYSAIYRKQTNTIDLTNPWGRIDYPNLSIEDAFCELDTIFPFKPPKSPKSKTNNTAPNDCCECLPYKLETSYPRNDYVLQYWDIMFSAATIVFLLYFNCPKYIVGTESVVSESIGNMSEIVGAIESSTVWQDLYVSFSGRWNILARLYMVPILFCSGLWISANFPTFYIPGQHLLLTAAALWWSGIKIDRLDELFGFFEITTPKSIGVSIGIFGLILLFVLQLDCAQQIVGFVTYITASLFWLVVVGGFEWIQLLYEQRSGEPFDVYKLFLAYHEYQTALIELITKKLTNIC